MIKLYQTYLSPFPTRVRLVLLYKGIEHEIIEPAGIHDSREKGEYLDVNPIGRVPALVLDDGRALPESEVICELLEEMYPKPAMMPKDSWGRAQVRLLSRISDIYIVMAMLPLMNMVSRPPKSWDQAAVTRAVNEVDKSLAFLEEYIGEEGYAYGSSLTHADGTLGPILQLADEWMPIFRGPPALAKYPKTTAYWKAIQQDKFAGQVIDETRQAVLKAMGRG